MRKALEIVITFITMAAPPAMAGTLDIYFIDVEGGQATLVVTPRKEALLIDAGWPGQGTFQSKAFLEGDSRDSQRIAAAARDAGVEKIEYLLVTHLHRDHMGGVPELAQRLPVETFIDYGHPSPAEALDAIDSYAFEAYAKVRAKGRHIQPKSGDRLPLKGVETIVVSTNGAAIPKPIAGAGAVNTACQASAVTANDRGENPRSTSILLQYGKFRFLNLGDLSGNPLFNLVCPTDRIGPVDVYLIAHHGAADAAKPATFHAFKPRVAVMNNGPRKGASTEVINAMKQVEPAGDVWQLHHSELMGADNAPQERIANLDEQTTHWIKISARKDGSFKILNGRTGVSEHYGVRPRD